MARIMKQQESLKSAFKKRAGAGLGVAITGVIIIAFFNQAQAALVGIVLIIAGLFLISSGHKFHIGAVGEGRVVEVLSSFPDDWYVFNDMIVGSSQIDHIVICPKGVYTIETKNYRGTIYGNAEKQEWYQVIESYTTPFYNPVKQGVGHSVALSKYLKESGFNKVWVNTIVVFTKPNVELKVFSPKVPVIHQSKLSEFFNNQKQVMNPDECSKIAKSVHKLIHANAKRQKGLDVASANMM
jgi:hypothetical protein